MTHNFPTYTGILMDVMERSSRFNSGGGVAGGGGEGGMLLGKMFMKSCTLFLSHCSFVY